MTREEAIEQLYNILFNNYRSAEKDKEALDMAIKALEQEPKKGKWIDCWRNLNNPKHIWWGGCICSICNEKTNAYYNFCPNCGSKMEREAEE